ncbi:MAG: EamA family transporter [Acidobacteria bacterium]|nr:EamA family transporter [Acidobacteriota bacterium]
MHLLIIVSLIWGFSFVIIKGSLTSLDSSFVSFVRLGLSLLIFVPLLKPAATRGREKLQLMLIGGLQFGIMYLAYIAAFGHLPAHLIALLTTTTPIFVSIFADILGRRFHRTAFLAAALAVAGGAVLEFPDQPFAASLRGVILVQVSNASFALGQVVYRNWMRARPSLRDSDSFGFLYAGAVVVSGLFFLSTAELVGLSVQPHQAMALLYLGLIASGICFFLWNIGARRVGVGSLAIMNNMKIPVAVIASITVLGEGTDWPRLIAGWLLMALALLVNTRDAVGLRLKTDT